MKKKGLKQQTKIIFSLNHGPIKVKALSPDHKPKLQSALVNLYFYVWTQSSLTDNRKNRLLKDVQMFFC